MTSTLELTYHDVAEHNTKKDMYLVIHDKIYDCAQFVDEHPYVYTVLLWETFPLAPSSPPAPIPVDGTPLLTQGQTWSLCAEGRGWRLGRMIRWFRVFVFRAMLTVLPQWW